MNAIITLATSKAIKDKAASTAREQILPGLYNVDFWARISGTVKVGEDFEKTPTCAIPYKKAFAALAAIAGCTRGVGVDMLRRAMQVALETESDAELELAKLFPMMEEMERSLITPMLQSLPKMTCKGTVTTKLDVDFTPARAANAA